MARWWQAVEESWIGLTEPPIAQQIRRTGWSPDEPEAYCPRCGRDAAPFAAGLLGCPACRTEKAPWDRMVRLGSYVPPLDGWVREVKFGRWRRLGSQLGVLLGRQVAATAQDLGPKARFVVVPVPTSSWRRLARGIDHSRVIARAVAKELDGPVWCALGRRHRPAQTGMTSESARRRNVRGSMYARGGWAERWVGSRAAWGLGLSPLGGVGGWSAEEVAGTVFLVVDDVATTGATMTEACRALRKGLKTRGIREARVWSAVVARTGEGRV